MHGDTSGPRGERAQWRARRALARDRDAAGDRATAAALACLDPRSWRVVHGVTRPGRPRTRIDHVVIGPPGILVVDSRNWSGAVTASAGVLRQDGTRRERHLRAAREAGQEVARCLRHLGPFPVIPVLCFTPPAMVTGWIEEVLLCATGDVVAVFDALSARVDPEDVDGLGDAVVEVLAPGRAVGSASTASTASTALEASPGPTTLRGGLPVVAALPEPQAGS